MNSIIVPTAAIAILLLVKNFIYLFIFKYSKTNLGKHVMLPKYFSVSL